MNSGKQRRLVWKSNIGLRVIFLLGLAAGTAACDQGESEKSAEGDVPQAPAGQVVARVNGQEITIHELSAEISRIRLDRNADRAAMERQVLRALVERTIFEQLAEIEGLERRPGVLQDIRRSRSAILAKAYASRQVSDRPAVGRSEAEKFVLDNPISYANREYLVFDAVVAKTSDLPEELKDELAELGDLGRIEARLRELGIEHRREPQTAFSNQLAKVMLDQLDELESSGRVFYMVSGAGTLISKLQIRRPAVLVGEEAIRAAKGILERGKFKEAFQQMRQTAIAGAETEFLGRFSEISLDVNKQIDSELAEQVGAAVNDASIDDQPIDDERGIEELHKDSNSDD